MADGDRIIIGQANIASNPGNMTSLSRNAATNRTVFVARNLNAGDGIQGQASGAGRSGVLGLSNAGFGVGGSSGMLGQGTTGVAGFSTVQGFGVYGSSVSSGIGVKGEIDSGVGVQGHSVNGAGVWGKCDNPSNNVSDRRAGGVFEGGVVIVNGLKPFTIDHPLDPENRYLVHTSVESSEMKNVYDGVAQLDEDGTAWVELPEWFEALNGDFRYQLTAIGGSAPGLHVAEEISEDRF